MLADSVPAVQNIQTLAMVVTPIVGVVVGGYLGWRASIGTRRAEKRWEAWYDLNHRLRAYCDAVSRFHSVNEDHIEAILEWGSADSSDRKEILRETAVLL